MKRDLRLTKPLTSSFLSCEKDAELIYNRLFVESQPYSDELKKLLIINTPDCLTNKTSQIYADSIKLNTAQMKKKGYIRFVPKVSFREHEQVKSYIILTFDNFTPNPTNPQFRDCIVTFDIICHTDYWDMGNYEMRPLKIAGYIDGLLDKTKITGIGQFLFAGCNELILSEDWAGYTLMYKAIHGSDDQIPRRDEDKDHVE